jgi:hypothetical protein
VDPIAQYVVVLQGEHAAGTIGGALVTIAAIAVVKIIETANTEVVHWMAIVKQNITPFVCSYILD